MKQFCFCLINDLSAYPGNLPAFRMDGLRGLLVEYLVHYVPGSMSKCFNSYSSPQNFYTNRHCSFRDEEISLENNGS